MNIILLITISVIAIIAISLYISVKIAGPAKWAQALSNARTTRAGNFQQQARIKAFRLDDESVQRQLISEYNLIQHKKSALSAIQRKEVEEKVVFMIAAGVLKVNISK